MQTTEQVTDNKVPEMPAIKEKGETTTAPVTGDNILIVQVYAMLLASLGLVLMLIKKKRYEAK